MAEHEHPTDKDLNAGYEVSDINIPRILIFVSIVAVFLVVAFILLNSFFISSKNKMYYQQVLEPGSEQLQQLQEQSSETLNSYGVVDSSQGIYRIPIDRAMKQFADEEFRERVQRSGEQVSN